MMAKWKKWILKNGILFVFGYCFYLAIEITFRGYSFRLMGLAGGLSLVILSSISRQFMKNCQLPLKMLAGAFVITGLELSFGLYAVRILHIRMWDYRERWLNLCGGLICPLYSLFWFFLSGIGILFADCWDYYVMGGQRRPCYHIFRKKFSLPLKH